MASKQIRTPPETVEVTVAVDTHTHAGKPCAKGDKLTVRPAVAKWMSDNRIIKEEIK